MNLAEVLTHLDQIDGDSVLYVQRENGKFSAASETVIIILNEEEQAWKTNEVTAKKCPGFDYFMEVFLVKEFMDELPETDFPFFTDKVKRLIYYVEHNA